MTSFSLVVFGGSGDLSHRYLFPSLFQLYKHGTFTADVRFVGFGRTDHTDESFQLFLKDRLLDKCTLDDGNCEDLAEEFLSKVRWVKGQYDSIASMAPLRDILEPFEQRVFYLALPPHVVPGLVRALAHTCEDAQSITGGHSCRIIVEKPLGRDAGSFQHLVRALNEGFEDQQVFLIDHYVHKSTMSMLFAMRFGNTIIEPLLNNQFVESIQISITETLGVEGRGGYFESAGIVRDLTQNHALQMAAFILMEEPQSLKPIDIRRQRANVLRQCQAIDPTDTIFGQYEGYREDPTVKDHSITPTFVSTVVHCQNRRWNGVPILIKTGKAQHSRRAEIFVKFKPTAGIYGADLPANTLHIEIQPRPSVSFSVMGVDTDLGASSTALEPIKLRYALAPDRTPDAYESLLAAVVNNDRSHFMAYEEVAESWRVVAPILPFSSVPLTIHPFGQEPDGMDELAAKHHTTWVRK